jgi:hypothetical protein
MTLDKGVPMRFIHIGQYVVNLDHVQVITVGDTLADAQLSSGRSLFLDEAEARLLLEALGLDLDRVRHAAIEARRRRALEHEASLSAALE